MASLCPELQLSLSFTAGVLFISESSHNNRSGRGDKCERRYPRFHSSHSNCVLSGGYRSSRRRNVRAHLELASTQLLAHLQSGINCPLQVSLQTTPKVPEHGGAS